MAQQQQLLPPTQWSTSVLDCCSAGFMPCCCCCFCPCYNYCQAMTIMDGSKSAVVECVKAVCCCCCLQRMEMRKHYNIAGNPLLDCFNTILCYECVGVQMLSEARTRMGLQHQPVPVVYQQAPPPGPVGPPGPSGPPGPAGPPPGPVHAPPRGGPGPAARGGGRGGPGGPGGPGPAGHGGHGGRGGRGGRGRGGF